MIEFARELTRRFSTNDQEKKPENCNCDNPQDSSWYSKSDDKGSVCNCQKSTIITQSRSKPILQRLINPGEAEKFTSTKSCCNCKESRAAVRRFNKTSDCNCKKSAVATNTQRTAVVPKELKECKCYMRQMELQTMKKTPLNSIQEEVRFQSLDGRKHSTRKCSNIRDQSEHSEAASVQVLRGSVEDGQDSCSCQCRDSKNGKIRKFFQRSSKDDQQSAPPSQKHSILKQLSESFRWNHT